MSALICGSFAYDTIMVFHDHFKNHILPDKVHILNVSFLVPNMRRKIITQRLQSYRYENLNLKKALISVYIKMLVWLDYSALL